MSFRFIHTADVHLDSPLVSLALRDADIAEVIGNATRQSFEKTVDLCLEEAVDALMIAGDLYDGDLRSMKTAVFFGSQMRRLTEAGIDVFIVRGNHDAESVITKQLSLPDGVHVFSGRGEAVSIKGKDVAVHGVSFGKPHMPDSLLAKYKLPVEGAANIGLLHTSLAGSAEHDVYAPCSLADLTDHGFDYWGLGHIHKRQVHATDPCTVVMPGIPQGRHVNEAGPKSVTLVEIGAQGVTVEERFTAVAQFERVGVTVDGVEDWRGVVRAIDDAVGAARDGVRADTLVARLEVRGKTPLAPRLRRDRDILVGEALQSAAAIGKAFIEAVTIDVGLPDMPSGHDPISELRTLIESGAGSTDAVRAGALDLLTALQEQLPAELRDAFGADDAALRQKVDHYLKLGSEEVLARLEAERADA
jgi:DNA repair exonuclease SbcCD nuclease subunit